MVIWSRQLVSGHRYFYAQLAVIAKPDIGRVSVFWEKYCQLAFVQMDKRVGSIAVKLYIRLLAVRHLRML